MSDTVTNSISTGTILDILATDQRLLTQLETQLLHHRDCIARRDTLLLQQSSQQLNDIATATEQNNQKKSQYLQALGIHLEQHQQWETIADTLTRKLPDAYSQAAKGMLESIKTLAENCRKLSRDNQKTIVLQMTLTNKALNRMRGPAIDNGSAYQADGSTSKSRDSLSLGMA